MPEGPFQIGVAAAEELPEIEQEHGLSLLCMIRHVVDLYGDFVDRNGVVEKLAAKSEEFASLPYGMQVLATSVGGLVAYILTKYRDEWGAEEATRTTVVIVSAVISSSYNIVGDETLFRRIVDETIAAVNRQTQQDRASDQAKH